MASRAWHSVVLPPPIDAATTTLARTEPDTASAKTRFKASGARPRSARDRRPPMFERSTMWGGETTKPSACSRQLSPILMSRRGSRSSKRWLRSPENPARNRAASTISRSVRYGLGRTSLPRPAYSTIRLCPPRMVNSSTPCSAIRSTSAARAASTPVWLATADPSPAANR